MLSRPVVDTVSAWTTGPTKAKVYDAALAGKDHYRDDRDVLDRLRRAQPGFDRMIRDQREFAIRVTRYLARTVGIEQFLHCGVGLPARQDNTHQIALRARPGARVVYLDDDPLVLAHARALLADNEQTEVSAADIFDPCQVLGDDIVRGHLDLTEPIALLHIGTLPHCPAALSPRDVLSEYIARLPAGSYVAISHFLDPDTDEHRYRINQLQHILHRALGSGTFVV
jgi:hypothetical protein